MLIKSLLFKKKLLLLLLLLLLATAWHKVQYLQY